MKAILHVLLLSLALIVVFTQCKKEPVPEPEPKVEIPDVNFLNALIVNGVDIDGDGQISNAEAEAVTHLDVSSCDISNMSGIEKFINLEMLVCYDNLLTTLDVSKNTALEVLDCWVTNYQLLIFLKIQH